MEGPFGYGKGWALRTGLSEPHSTKTPLGLKKGKHFLSHVAKGGHVTLFWSHDIRDICWEGPEKRFPSLTKEKYLEGEFFSFLLPSWNRIAVCKKLLLGTVAAI